MLVSTARSNDLVEVINEESPYFGKQGMIKSILDNSIGVYLFDLDTTIFFSRYSLLLIARRGTSKYDTLMDELTSKKESHLTWEDYNNLMDLALDVGEYEWAYELKQKRDRLKKQKGASE